MAAEKGKQDLADTWAEPSFRYVAAGWKKHESAGAAVLHGYASGTDGLLSTEVGKGAAFALMLIAWLPGRQFRSVLDRVWTTTMMCFSRDPSSLKPRWRHQ